MTAKEALREYIDGLSEDEALSLWQRVQCEQAEGEYLTLTPEESAMIERSLAQIEAGLTIPHAQVMREMRDRFGD